MKKNIIVKIYFLVFILGVIVGLVFADKIREIEFRTEFSAGMVKYDNYMSQIKR